MGVAEVVGFGGEIDLGSGSLEPLFGEGGGDGRFSAILGEVRQGAAESGGAEGLGVFAVFVDILWVEGEESVVGGVVAGPEEGSGPGIARGEPGEFEVVRGGEGVALHGEHGGCEREKDCDGKGCEREAGCAGALALAGFEGELGEVCSEQKGHDRVEEEEDPERLHAGDEMGGGAFVREEQDNEGGDAADGDIGAAEVGGVVIEGGGLFAEVAQEEGKNGERAGEAEEFEPLPLGEEPVVAGHFGGDEGG